MEGSTGTAWHDAAPLGNQPEKQSQAANGAKAGAGIQLFTISGVMGGSLLPVQTGALGAMAPERLRQTPQRSKQYGRQSSTSIIRHQHQHKAAQWYLRDLLGTVACGRTDFVACKAPWILLGWVSVKGLYLQGAKLSQRGCQLPLSASMPLGL